MTDDVILMAHGAGGRKSTQLVAELFLQYFQNPALNLLGDSAQLSVSSQSLAFTTDAFVVDPLFFPGGDIGRLAICGTVNDLVASGADPIGVSAAFILEEGLHLHTLERIVASMAETAASVPVPIVAGDTKVVPRRSADRVFVITSGIGCIPADRDAPAPDKVMPGDVVVLNGSIGDHGMAVMAAREGIRLSSTIESDCAALNSLVAAMFSAEPNIHCLRDPTRGGLAAALNEIAKQSRVCIEIEENALVIHDDVRVACELLGIDPFHVANEGKILAMVPQSGAEAVISAMRRHPLGREAGVIGRVVEEPPGRVHVRTAFGSVRVLDVPTGELLPRVC